MDTCCLSRTDQTSLSYFICTVCEVFCADDETMSFSNINSVFYGVADCLAPNDPAFKAELLSLVLQVYKVFIAEKSSPDMKVNLQLAHDTLFIPAIHADAVPGGGPTI